MEEEEKKEVIEEPKAQEQTPVEAEAEVKEEEAPVQEETALTRESIIARLQEMVGDINIAKRPELESLKQAFYRLQRAAQEEQIAAFVAGGGTAEEFKPEPDPLEEQFRKLLNIIREKKAAAQEALEIVQKENYRRKLELLERFKALIEKANTEGASYNEFLRPIFPDITPVGMEITMNHTYANIGIGHDIVSALAAHSALT